MQGHEELHLAGQMRSQQPAWALLPPDVWRKAAISNIRCVSCIKLMLRLQGHEELYLAGLDALSAAALGPPPS